MNKQNDIEAAIAHVKEDIENLAHGWEFEDGRSIDYEYGNLEVTVGDLRTILSALEAQRDGE